MLVGAVFPVLVAGHSVAGAVIAFSPQFAFSSMMACRERWQI
jgi:hypothetical protein